MLERLQLDNVGPAPTMAMELAPRINLITGDNGFGKSFLLDVAWWALTRAGSAASCRLCSKYDEESAVDRGSRGESGPLNLAW